MKVILISIGNFQEYILYNIKNLLLHENSDITVITNNNFFEYFHEFPFIELIDCNTLDDLNYNNTSQLNRSFRNGFWYYASLRLFYLYSYIKKFNIEYCVHIENDVLIYENLNKLPKKNFIYAPFDAIDRVIPSFIYIPNHMTFKPILDNYYYNLNDMENLAKFSFIKSLPIIPIINNEVNKFNENFGDFNCIFDAAAMGQYLGGIDPRNQNGDTRGFINETCVIKYNNFKFYWIKENNLYKPFILINNNLIKIINLHIHSKQLQNFLSDNPIESNYLIIIN
jgi:hypothetical protein